MDAETSASSPIRVGHAAAVLVLFLLKEESRLVLEPRWCGDTVWAGRIQTFLQEVLKYILRSCRFRMPRRREESAFSFDRGVRNTYCMGENNTKSYKQSFEQNARYQDLPERFSQRYHHSSFAASKQTKNSPRFSRGMYRRRAAAQPPSPGPLPPAREQPPPRTPSSSRPVATAGVRGARWHVRHHATSYGDESAENIDPKTEFQPLRTPATASPSPEVREK